MRIGITYNLKTDRPFSPNLPRVEEIAEEFDRPETVAAIREVLRGEGHEVFLLGADRNLLEKIDQEKIEFVFNIAEGFFGRARESQIPALLELGGIPYSGSDPAGLALTLDKSLAKRIASSLGIPTPEFWILDEINHVRKVPDRFPLFVKPLWQGSSIGIRRSSRVRDRTELEREGERLFASRPSDPVLVEEYIAGKECTVGLLGNETPEALGVMEIAFRDSSKKDFCYSLEVKQNWKEEVDYLVPPRLPPETEQGMAVAAVELFRTFRLRDFARFDFRVDDTGKFYFLESNPLPGLSPESGDFIILARKKGWSYEKLISKITHLAMSRYPGFNGR